MDVNLEKEMGLVEAVLFLDSEPLTVESIAKIAELSERCGYENVNTFTRQFKQYTGTTPSKYKTFFNGEA